MSNPGVSAFESVYVDGKWKDIGSMRGVIKDWIFLG